MKKLFILFCLLFSGYTLKAQSTAYSLAFSKDNVDVYSRWTCDDCSDKHIVLKIVNRNNVKVTIVFDHFQWLLKGSKQMVKEDTGADDDLGPNKTKSGDYSGYWFYPPKGYSSWAMASLDFKLENFKVYVGGK